MNLALNAANPLPLIDMGRIFNRRNLTLGAGVIALLGLVIASTVVQAGSGGSEFSDLWDLLKGWTQGTLGKVIVGAMIIVGIIGGIARQSIMAFAVGLGGGIGLYYAPDIVESIMSATLPVSAGATQAVHALSNGLM